jgi:hypothetical protein
MMSTPNPHLPWFIEGNIMYGGLLRGSKMVATVKTAQTFTFDEDAIRALLVEYMAANHQVDVEAKDFNFDISDSTTTGYMDDQHVPAKLKGVSITLSNDDKK